MKKRIFLKTLLNPNSKIRKENTKYWKEYLEKKNNFVFQDLKEFNKFVK